MPKAVAELAAERRDILKSTERDCDEAQFAGLLRIEAAMGQRPITTAADQAAALEVLLENECGFSDNSSLAIVEALLAGAQQNAKAA